MTIFGKAKPKYYKKDPTFSGMSMIFSLLLCPPESNKEINMQ